MSCMKRAAPFQPLIQYFQDQPSAWQVWDWIAACCQLKETENSEQLTFSAPRNEKGNYKDFVTSNTIGHFSNSWRRFSVPIASLKFTGGIKGLIDPLYFNHEAPSCNIAITCYNSQGLRLLLKAFVLLFCCLWMPLHVILCDHAHRNL